MLSVKHMEVCIVIYKILSISPGHEPVERRSCKDLERAWVALGEVSRFLYLGERVRLIDTTEKILIELECNSTVFRGDAETNHA